MKHAIFPIQDVVDLPTRVLLNDPAAPSQTENDPAACAPARQACSSWTAAGSLAAGILQGATPPTPARHGPSAEQVMAAASAFGIGTQRYAAYAAQRWGGGWSLNADGRRRALDELERYRNGLQGLIHKIEMELRTADSPDWLPACRWSATR
jgi:hypothetical protein